MSFDHKPRLFIWGLAPKELKQVSELVRPGFTVLGVAMSVSANHTVTVPRTSFVITSPSSQETELALALLREACVHVTRWRMGDKWDPFREHGWARPFEGVFE